MRQPSAEADELLKDIIDQPSDDTPRLLLADWLEDNGQPDRAEFIRAQIKQATVQTPGDERALLLASEWRIGSEHRKDWLGALADLPLTEQFSRGLVAAVRIRTDDFLAHASVIFAAQPVVHVELSDKRPSRKGHNRYRWLLDRGGVNTKAAGLPSRIWELLGHPQSGYATRPEAQEALSKACVCWGRVQAGLPELSCRSQD